MRADTLSLASGMLQKYEGFISKPKYDVNHERVGFGSDTITTADGRVLEVKKGMTVTREDALRDLHRRLPEFENGIIRTVGKAAWDALPSNAQASLLSVAYNYGSIDKLRGVKKAIQSGNLQQIANSVRALQVHNKGVNAKRRNGEADFILGEGNITPANIPDSYAQQQQQQPVQQASGTQDLFTSIFNQPQQAQQPQARGGVSDLFGNFANVNNMLQSPLSFNAPPKDSNGLADLFELRDLQELGDLS